MKKMVGWFVGVYVVASLAAALVVVGLGLKSQSLTVLPPLLLATFVAAHQFVKTYARKPTPHESRQFASASLAAVVALSLLVLAVLDPKTMLMLKLVPALGGLMLVLLGVLLVTLSISWFALRWGFGWYAGLLLKSRKGPPPSSPSGWPATRPQRFPQA